MFLVDEVLAVGNMEFQQKSLSRFREFMKKEKFRTAWILSKFSARRRWFSAQALVVVQFRATRAVTLINVVEPIHVEYHRFLSCRSCSGVHGLALACFSGFPYVSKGSR